MILSDISIKRPVFATVMSLVLVVFGIVSFLKLDIRGVPKIDPPLIMVQTVYPGASASYMESNITSLIEKQLRTVKKVDFIQSSSAPGRSYVIVFFKLDANLNDALSDIRSKIAELSYYFPDDMKLPTVAKQDPDSFPSMWIAASSDRHDDMQLTEIIDQKVTQALSKISSVGTLNIFGARDYKMKIEPDPAKLYAYKISPTEIESQVKAQSTNYPAGKIQTNVLEYIFQLKGGLNTAQGFANIIIKQDQNGIIKLGDIANVSLSTPDQSLILRHNGELTIAVGIVKQSDANVIELSKDVNQALPEIQANMPPGVKLKIAYDAAVPVKESVDSVYKTVAEALILVMIITYLFLGSLKITIIPFVTIPISLITSFGFMKLYGFSINTFTLLALVLAIGLVVDDAIVVLENVYRHVEKGMSKVDAAFKAMQEIGFAVVAMTLTLASVFLPIGFLDGFIGKLFIEFAWTLAFAVIISGFVALTLTPMMCSKMVSVSENTPVILRKFEYLLHIISNHYIKSLRQLIENKKLFWLIVALSVFALFGAFKIVKKTFVPTEDDGYLFINVSGPEGFSLENTDRGMRDVNKIFAKHKDLQEYITVTGGDRGDNNGFGIVIMKPWSQRNKSQAQIKDELNAELSKIVELNVFAMNPPSMVSGPQKKPIEFNLQVIGELAELKDCSSKFVQTMENHDVFQGVSDDLDESTPTLDVVINRDKAAKYNVKFETVGRTLQYLYGGKNISDFNMNNKNYDVKLMLKKEDRNQIADISKIWLKSDSGQMISLDTVADVYDTATIRSFNHYNLAKAITITANLNPKYTLQDAVAAIEEIKAQVITDPKIKLEYLGDIKRMNQSGASMLVTFMLGIVFIYLVLSAQFESFKDPLIILCAVPFAITGGVFFLYLFGSTLNLYSNIGLITLIGLVTKNSIMIIEFTNQLRETGHKLIDALLEACRLRLRPILMTSLATSVGALPLAFASGAGAASQSSIGLCIVGGMIIGTLFTLFIIPTLYVIFKK